MNELIKFLVTFYLTIFYFTVGGRACNGDNPGCCSDFPILPQVFTLPEDTQTGYVLYTFEMNMVDISLSLKPEGINPEGYLVLETKGNTNVIYLNHSLDLNLLDPPTLKEPTTAEYVKCNYSVNTGQKSQVKSGVRYSLSCNYSNSMSPTSASVFVSVVAVNTNPPAFYCAPYHKELGELTAVGTTVFRMTGLTYDPDVEGGIGSLYIQENDYFRATDNITGEIITKRKLDYDFGHRLFVLPISVTDVGEPVSLESRSTISFTVKDEDDQVPVFTQSVYSIKVPENSTQLINTSLETSSPVAAFDQDYDINATILYTIAECCLPFIINETTGEIIQREILDREEKESYYFQIHGYQEDEPVTRRSFAFVHMLVDDINDNRPEMLQSRQNVTISEHAARGSLAVTVSASDRDIDQNSVFEYQLAGESGLFTIDAITGNIYVNRSDELDRELNDTYIIQVFVQETLTKEKWRSDVSQVYVFLSDINDNNPAFTSNGIYIFYSHFEVQKGGKLGQVEASDADSGPNAQILYSFPTYYQSDDEHHVLSIDPVSGWITASTDFRLDINSTVRVIVEAGDQPSMHSDQRHSFAVVDIIFTNDSAWTTCMPTLDVRTSSIRSTEVTSHPHSHATQTTDATQKNECFQLDGLVIAIGILVLLIMILLLIVIALLLSKQRLMQNRVDKGSLTDPCHHSLTDTVSLVPNEENHHTIFCHLDDETSTDVPRRCPTLSRMSQELTLHSSVRSSKRDTATNTNYNPNAYRNLFIQFENEASYSDLSFDPVSQSSNLIEKKLFADNQGVTNQDDNSKFDFKLNLAIVNNTGHNFEEVDFSNCRAEEVIDIDIPCDSPRSSATSQSDRTTNTDLGLVKGVTSDKIEIDGVSLLTSDTCGSDGHGQISLDETSGLAKYGKGDSKETNLHVTEISLLDNVLSSEAENRFKTTWPPGCNQQDTYCTEGHKYTQI